MTSRASAKVVGSGTVGPEATASSGEPTTSLTMSVTTRAGAAACASRPPAMRDRCLRTAFTSAMGAPARISACVAARRSVSVTPATGAGQSADAPPESRQSTTSPSPARRATSSAATAAARPCASGTGCAASQTSILGGSDVRVPCGTVTVPPAIASPSTSSAPSAIPAAAFPAAISQMRPPGRGRARSPGSIASSPSCQRSAR